MGLKEHREYFYFCDLWGSTKVVDLMRAGGFLSAETDLSRILECGLDSRDEDHFLMDIWEK